MVTGLVFVESVLLLMQYFYFTSLLEESYHKIINCCVFLLTLNVLSIL